MNTKMIKIRNMKVGEHTHQGDVVLTKIRKNELPKELIEVKNKTLAYGEVTGHSHRFETEQALVYSDGNVHYVQVLEPSELIHEEHAIQEIPKGVYKVEIQREFDVVEGIRQVMD